MIILGAIALCLATFSFGFILGLNQKPNKEEEKKTVENNEAFLKLQQEYSNFLNYDGNSQL